MRYLSIDIEATGLEQNCLIIEFAAVPFDCHSRLIRSDLAFHSYISCPSFESLRPSLNPWVIEHNKKLIETCHKEGVPLLQFKKNLEEYLTSNTIQTFFNKERVILFGKSLNSIDLPFLTRDLGWEWMQKFFAHKVLDLSSVNYSLIDLNCIPTHVDSGSKLMDFLQMGDVVHEAMQDAVNTINMYFKLLDLFSKKS